MASARIAQPAARSWNPNFKHTDRERWICIYPTYINSKRSISQGRIISKEKAVADPTFSEIKEVCSSTGLLLGVENKVYPRELDVRDIKVRGRIRIQLKNDDGKPILERFPNRKSLLCYCAEMIPKLKSRTNVQSVNQPSSSSSHVPQTSKSHKKKKGKR